MNMFLRWRFVANDAAVVTFFFFFFFSCLSIGFVESANNVDLFNYDYPNEGVPGGGGTDYGQPAWDKVSCEDLDQCAGWPDKFLSSVGFTVAGSNNCKWCLDSGNHNCGAHKQSPINLIRDNKDTECIDWHFMRYDGGACTWEDMKNNFEITRNRLRIMIPQLDNGEINCDNNGRRYYPRVDFSKGYPNPWYLDHTDISVPSNHVQEGKRYDAEVNLAHFYSVKHDRNQLGYVSFFLEQYPNTTSWAYLDKLICQWRIEEEKVRLACGLEPAPPYGRCQLFRGQTPTKAWLEEAGLLTNRPTRVPKTPPPRGGGGGLNSRPPTNRFKNENKVATEAPGVAATSQPTNVPSPAPTTTQFPSTTYAPTIWDDTWDDPTATPTDASTPSFSPTIWDDTGNAQTATPTDASFPTYSPTINPTSSPVVSGINCPSYNVDYSRMCEDVDTACCNSVRSDTDFCWDIYENVFPGDQIYDACNQCCPSGPKTVGPPHPEKSGLPQTIKCSRVINPFQICSNCCGSTVTNTRNLRTIGSVPNSVSATADSTITYNYCEDDVLPYYSDIMEEICYYCCSESKEFVAGNRNLQSDSGSGIGSSSGANDENPKLSGESPISTNDPEDGTIPEGAKVINAVGRRHLLRKENFEVSKESDEEWMERLDARFNHGIDPNVIHEIDYEDVPYYEYEWYIKVNTEYYFRYEGTMLVPPCWETVHWRVLKDPIQVNVRQIKELNRLLAWRISPSGDNYCQPDTAGRVTNSGDRVKEFRDLQYYNIDHKMTFCECKDWPSKFDADRQWCYGWRTQPEDIRYYWRPYNFDTDGKF